MNIFFPTEYVPSMQDYDFNRAYKKGKRLILFDIDNTIVPHGAPADERSINFMSALKDMGFKLCCVSNNNPLRVKPFADACGIKYVCLARKPEPAGFKTAMEEAGAEKSETLFFGDQIFTDVMGANRAGIDCVLVKPLDRSTDPSNVAFKRFWEWPILKLYFLLNGLK